MYSRPLLFKQMLEKLSLDRLMRARVSWEPLRSDMVPPVIEVEPLDPRSEEQSKEPITGILPQLPCTSTNRAIPDISTLLLPPSRLPLLDVPIEEMHTQLLPAMAGPVSPFQTEPIPTQDMLPRDSEGRHYVVVREATLPTYDLVDMLVEQYHESMHAYPSEILLSAQRYLFDGLAMQYYYPRQPGAPRIPFVYEDEYDYEVLVRE